MYNQLVQVDLFSICYDISVAIIDTDDHILRLFKLHCISLKAQWVNRPF